jgi:capsular exopolysaccharide synthesis family protein
MDYIQKAIDKARNQRESGSPAETSSPEVSAEARKATRKAGRFSLRDGINYTRTRQVTVDDETLRKQRVLAGFTFDKRAEPYRQLRTQVLQKLRANNWKTLAITSPNDSAGKTLTAVNLAISLSMEVNQTVMLVDLDLKNPGVLKTFTIDAEHGLVDHLKGEVDLADILINPGFERLVLLPCKADNAAGSELLSSPEMESLITDLTSRYESRIIIFDLPAVLSGDDALAFIPRVDAALLVIEDGASSKEDIERSLQLLSGTNLLGTVLNKAGS